MVQRRVLGVMFVLLSAAVLAGCVDDGADVDPGASGDAGALPGTGGGGNISAAPTNVLTKVTGKEAVFGPTWKQGQAWTYAVSGSMAGGDYTTTIGVYEVAADHYKMASDNEKEEELRLLNDGSLFLNGVQKDSLAVFANDEWHDLIGFSRAAGETWDALVFDVIFTMKKVGVQEIKHAAGGSAGIRVEGTKADHTLVVEYASDAQNVALFEWKNKDTVLLSYKLQSYEASGATGLFTWVVKDLKRMTAQWTLEAVGGTTWQSDGSGTMLVVLAKASAHDRPARGFWMDPSNEIAVEYESTPNVRTEDLFRLDDQAGTWTGLGVSLGSRLDLILHQIVVEQH